MDAFTLRLAAIGSVTVACLFALSLLIRLREEGMDPLDAFTRLVRRPVSELALLLFFIGGFVQYGATKGTNGMDRGQSAPILRSAPCVTPVAVDSDGFAVPTNAPPVTNLCFWGIECGSNSVAFGMAWPETVSFTNGLIDLFGHWELVTNGWSHLAEIDVSEAESNAVFEIDVEAMPTNMESVAFFRLASQDDSDGDGLSDSFEEWTLGTNPLVADSDGDGLLDGYELSSGTDPFDADTDGDGLTDGEERSYGLNPRNADTDGDGLPDGAEVNIYDTNPFYFDSDEDGMADGWEVDNGFDPMDDSGANGASGDPDLDGVCNVFEYMLNSNPRSTDSDGDGVSDYDEICAGADPASAADGGVPSPAFPYRGMLFNIDGDYAAWKMYVGGIGPNDLNVFSLSMDSPGAGSDKMLVLEKGNSYYITMRWLNSDGHTNPNWYCWQAQINGLPTSESYWSYTTTLIPGNEIVYGPRWMANNSLGLLTSHVHMCDGAGGNVAEGLWAILNVYKCSISICDESWTELAESRVLLDDEDLRIRVEISPALPDFDTCRLVMGSNIVVRTSGTCPTGVQIPLVESDFTNRNWRTEIRITRTRSQLKSLGLLPSTDEDGINEMSVYDIGTLDGVNGSDLSDSLSFEGLGMNFRGRATGEAALTLCSTPPNSRLSESFFKSAGAEVISVSYCDVEAPRRQIMNQADYFYCSCHGYHINGWLGNMPHSVVDGWWNRDLNCAIFAGCSVLDINDYNNNYWSDLEEHNSSPGRLWESVGPGILLGYNYSAPADAGGAPARIAQSWVSDRSSLGDVNAWMKANADNKAWNACAIVKGEKYVYFASWLGFRKMKEIMKENW